MTQPRKKTAKKKTVGSTRVRKATVAPGRAQPDALSGRSGGDVAVRMLRDTRIVARKVQGWPWEAIAKEAGLTVTGAKRAFASRRAVLPMTLRMDPVEVIENVAEGLTMSIGDLEAIAADAMARNQLNAAVGAKKAANDARARMIELLQATGKLPQDLKALRHLIDLRMIALRMLDAVDGFDREVQLVMQIEDVDTRLREAAEASSKVRTTFDDLLGIEQGSRAVIEGSVSQAG